jgi:hypothetical protein
MSKRIKNRPVTKGEPKKGGQQLVIQELRIMSANRSEKDIGEFTSALQAAESVHYPQRVRYYDLCDHILLDGQLTGLIEKRIAGVLNKKIRYDDKAGKRVDAMDDIIRSNVFRDIVRKIMETILFGLSGLEFVPGEKLCFYEIPRKHIKPHKKVIAFEQLGEDGVSYEGVSNLWIIGKEKELGLLLKCAPYAIWKRGDMADWAQYIEVFGQPVRIIKYDAYDEKTKFELKQVLDESGSSLAMMIPKQADFDIKDGKGTANANGELQEKFKTACDQEMSVIILGNTETTTSSSSSGYAQSKEHGKQQNEITKSDIEFVQNMLNEEHFLKILKSYGLPIVEGGRFTFEKEIDLGQLKERLAIDTKVNSIVPIADEYFYETFGIPKPENYDELKAKREAEQQAKVNPPAPAPVPPAPAPDPKKKPDPKPQAKPKVKNLSAGKALLKLRELLADFFDPAP